MTRLTSGGIIVTSLIVFLLAGVRHSEATAQCLRYWPAVNTLKGTLTVVERYGRPGFGENPKTDSRVRVPILVLSQPVDVCADGKDGSDRDSFRGVREVQLSVLKWSQLEPYVGREVVVTGTLSEAVTANDYTNVVCTVKKLADAYRPVDRL